MCRSFSQSVMPVVLGYDVTNLRERPNKKDLLCQILSKVESVNLCFWDQESIRKDIHSHLLLTTDFAANNQLAPKLGIIRQ